MAAIAAREVASACVSGCTPTIAAWHFPGTASPASAAFSRNNRFAAPPTEFAGCYPRHPMAGLQSPLPYCSPSCSDCPTSTRLLLVLHSLSLGLGTDGWGGGPDSQPIPLEKRCRWSRRGWKRRGHPRVNAVTTEQISRVSEQMTPPFNVLITGSSKGIGYALAREFLRQGDNVIICSRSEERVQSALEKLTKEYGQHRAWDASETFTFSLDGKMILRSQLANVALQKFVTRMQGTTCDVRNAKSISALADFAKSQVGYVDIWINNAGTNAYTYKALVDTDDAAIAEIVTTNTLGVMLCCREAVRTMKEQPRGGHIFNMDGAGADGNPTPRFAAYGATKRSLAQFTKSLQAELKQQGIKDVVVHNLSPGMVTTDLLMSGSDSRQAKFFINVLAEPAEEVASYLVPRIRAVPGDKSKTSKYIRFLTGVKAYTQILARLIFKVRKDRFIPED